MSVFIEQVLRDDVPVFPGKVNIKVGRGRAFRVEKAFKVKIEINGIYIGDTQAVGNEAISPASPANEVKIGLFGKIDQVVSDEVVGGKIFGANDI